MGTALLYVIDDNPMKQLKLIEKSWSDLHIMDGRTWWSNYKPSSKWCDFLLKSFPNKHFRCLKKDLKAEYLPYYILYDGCSYKRILDADEKKSEEERIGRGYNYEYEKYDHEIRCFLNSLPDHILITARVVKD